MATEKWAAGSGVGFTWTACFSTEVNSIVTGNAILSTVLIDNTTALDEFCDISFSMGSITPTGASYLGVYFHPLNQDTTTYGDGRFGSSAAGPPASQYFAGAATLVNAAQVQTGMIRGVILPPNKFKMVLYNVSGVTLAGSANTIKYWTYNRSVA